MDKYKDKTAFILRHGLYRFVSMPFGLCDAQKTFQRNMSVILFNVNWQFALVYFDSIVMFSKTLEKRIETSKKSRHS